MTCIPIDLLSRIKSCCTPLFIEGRPEDRTDDKDYGALISLCEPNANFPTDIIRTSFLPEPLKKRLRESPEYSNGYGGNQLFVFHYMVDRERSYKKALKMRHTYEYFAARESTVTIRAIHQGKAAMQEQMHTWIFQQYQHPACIWSNIWTNSLILADASLTTESMRDIKSNPDFLFDLIATLAPDRATVQEDRKRKIRAQIYDFVEQPKETIRTLERVSHGEDAQNKID